MCNKGICGIKIVCFQYNKYLKFRNCEDTWYSMNKEYIKEKVKGKG